MTETKRAVRSFALDRAFLAQQVFDLLHAMRSHACHPAFRPIGRVDARLAAKRIDAQAGIVGKRRQAGRHGRGMRLDIGVLLEGRAGFVRLGQAEIGGRARLEARTARSGR